DSMIKAQKTVRGHFFSSVHLTGYSSPAFGGFSPLIKVSLQRAVGWRPADHDVRPTLQGLIEDRQPCYANEQEAHRNRSSYTSIKDHSLHNKGNNLLYM
ncbi:hypothetical protein, partial [Paenibacillus oleatilyticus]|uniref:hypothetical protein n=1 Tax=Paenibacillus oleatilyticus TaxID=2594886 RepID=UPI001C1F5BFA